ncbi:umcharacterized LOC128071545 homolog [Aotus nancymaae]
MMVRRRHRGLGQLSRDGRRGGGSGRGSGGGSGLPSGMPVPPGRDG